MTRTKGKRGQNTYSPCPTCGGRYMLGVRKGGRAYARSGRVYWPIRRLGSKLLATCPDPSHTWWWQQHVDKSISRDEQVAHVASLPHEGAIPLRSEVKERAATTRRRNRQRQGKDAR